LREKRQKSQVRRLENRSYKKFNVSVDSVLVGHGSNKQKEIARLNAARDALQKLNGEKSYLLIKSQRKEVEDEKVAKQKLNEFCMKRHWPLPEYV
jgi:dsRNA-specific ribonuclease